MTLRESDCCIVPHKPADQAGLEKPGNAGAGKAARASGDSDRTPPVLRDGYSVLTRLYRIALDSTRTTVMDSALPPWCTQRRVL